MKSKRIFSFLFSFFPFATAFSQTNLQKGFVVQSNGDTVKGFIDYRNWATNPSAVRFAKTTDQRNAETLQPEQIQAFGVQTANGTEIYRSAVVNYISSSDKLSDLTTQSEPERVTKPLFLLLLEDGHATLCQYLDANERMHLFLGRGKEMNELINYRYYNDNRLLMNKTFQQQLSAFFQDCAALASVTAADVRYDGKSIGALIRQYNLCKQSSSYSFQEEKTPVRFHALAGLHTTSLAIGGTYPNTLLSAPSTAGAIGGVAAQFVLSRNRQRTSILLEGLFKQQKHTATGKDYRFERDYLEFTLRENIVYLQLNALARYTFTNGALKPFLQLGFGNHFGVSFKNEMQTHRVFYTTETNTTEAATAFGKKYEIGLIGGGGVEFGRSSLQVRAVVSNGAGADKNATTSVKTFSFLYGFRL